MTNRILLENNILLEDFMGFFQRNIRFKKIPERFAPKVKRTKYNLGYTVTYNVKQKAFYTEKLRLHRYKHFNTRKGAMSFFKKNKRKYKNMVISDGSFINIVAIYIKESLISLLKQEQNIFDSTKSKIINILVSLSEHDKGISFDDYIRDWSQVIWIKSKHLNS